MENHLVTYQFRLRPSKSQMRTLSRWMGACRFLYNGALEQRKIAYEINKKSLSYYSQQNELPSCKKTEGLEWLREVPSQSLQMALRHLDRAFQNFFSGRAFFPKRKKKGRCTDAISFPQLNHLRFAKLTNKKSILFGLPKIKDGLKFVQHRKIEGKPKVATIVKKSDKWFVSITCEQEKTKTSELQGSIGIDLGISKTIATTSQDYSLNVASIKSLEQDIGKIQRRLSKEKKFSDRWKSYQKIVTQKHSKISRIRKDFLHQVSSDICKNNAIVCMENLKVKNMSRSSKGTLENPGKMVAQKSGLNRSILRQGWGMFREMCEYKTKKYGGILQVVSPRNTSRKCSSCGYTNEDNRKTQSSFSCVNCDHSENADKNAAKNIMAIGLNGLGLETLEAPTIALRA